MPSSAGRSTLNIMFGTVIHLSCPQCKRSTRDAEGMNVATTVVRRKCQKCKTSWVVVIRPLTITEDLKVHKVEWTAR